MTTNILEINNFIVLIEESNDSKMVIEKCDLNDQVVGFSFYASGDVALTINYGDKKKVVNNTSGMATSFFGNKNAAFTHEISHGIPLKSVSIFSTLSNLKKLPIPEKEIYSAHLDKLINPAEDYVEGPYFFMTPEMQNAVFKIFNTTYTGSLRKLFLESQIKELLIHFLAHLSYNKTEPINSSEREKLFQAKEIISNNIVSPPSLSDLSKTIGLNNNKLKKNFKELFGIPVFKYLQQERLNKAYSLLSDSELSIQEVAWDVGYESVSSFSNAFLKKFGYRPSAVNK